MKEEIEYGYVDMAYENRLGWDELTEPQRRRRMESRIDAADFRRKEMRENEMAKGMEEGGEHEHS